jgi:hypothetical protein
MKTFILSLSLADYANKLAAIPARVWLEPMGLYKSTSSLLVMKGADRKALWRNWRARQESNLRPQD